MKRILFRVLFRIRLFFAHCFYIAGALLDPRVSNAQALAAWRLYWKTGDKRKPFVPDTRYRLGRVKRR